MMRLIYFWTDREFGDLKYRDGFNISPSYNVKVCFFNFKIYVSKNKNLQESFYGENIKDVIAIVGENGAGKTTIAKEIVNRSYEEKYEISKLYNFIEIYEEYGELIIYYNLNKEKFEIIYDGKIKIENNIGIIQNYNEFELGGNHEISSVYISNSFDSFGDSETGVSNIIKSKIYTPGSILSSIEIKQKDKYGQQYDGFIHRNIEYYANKMKMGFIKDYENYEARNFIRTYLNVQSEVIKSLKIFKYFNISILQFGYYCFSEYNYPNRNLENLAKFVQNHNDHFKKSGEGDLFDECYLNILCEAYIFFAENKEGKANELGEYILDIISKSVIIKNNDFEFENIKLYPIERKIKFDINVLVFIKEYIKNKSGNKKLIQLQWYKDFCQSIEEFKFIKDRNLKLKLESIGQKFEFNKIKDFMKFYNDILKKENSIFKRYIIFKSFPGSGGEKALLNLLGYIDDFMSAKTEKNIIIVIDEIDLYLHPRWQQVIFRDILEWLKTTYRNKNIQLIITTHSPILLSDFTNDRVIKLKKIEDGNKIIVKNISTENEMVFAANIQTLFYDNFFMDKGSIGEFAKSKINEVIKFNNDESNNDGSNIKNIEYIIDNIADDFIKSVLKKQFEKKQKIINKKKEEAFDILKNQISIDGIDNVLMKLKKM